MTDINKIYEELKYLGELPETSRLTLEFPPEVVQAWFSDIVDYSKLEVIK